MKKSKPLFLQTYGKQKRKVSAWILPEDHKQAFDSSRTTEDDSVFEPPKPKKTKVKKAGVSTRTSLHPAGKKTVLRPKGSSDEGNTSNEENIMPRWQKTSVTRGRAVRPAKRKAILQLRETGSDQSHVESPPFSLPQQSKTARSTQHVSATGVSHSQRGERVSVISQSEESMAAPKPTSSFKRKTISVVCPPSVGRFVTRRRRSVAAKPPKPPKAVLRTSSDEFSSGEICTNRVLRPQRRKKILSAILLSSAENSLNPEGTSSFTNPFREISLNVSVDHSPMHCPRKPIFCSTPSAGFYTKPGQLKPSPISGQSCIPPSGISVNGPTVDTFQENPDSSELPVPLQQSAIVRGLHSEEKFQSSLGELQKEPELHHHEDLSVVLFTQIKSDSCSEEAKSDSDKSKAKDGEGVPSVILTSTDSESDFVSAAAGLEWLIEALKENCLTKQCIVQLERLDYLTVTQLCSQTTYSSCLEPSCTDHSQQTNERSVDNSQTSLNLHLSVTNNVSSNYLQSVNNSEQAALVTDISSLAGCNESAECSSTKTSIELSSSDSTHHMVTSFEEVTDAQTPASVSVGEALKRCSIQIKKMDLSLLELKGCAQKKEAGLSYEMSNNHVDYTHNVDGPEYTKCSGEITDTKMSTDKKAALLKEQCLSDKLVVKIKRATLSQYNAILQPKGAMLKSHTYTSDSASDDQAKADHLSEAGYYKGPSSTKEKKVDSTSGEDSSDKDIGKDSRRNIPKRKKADKEKKRYDVSTDRLGTTRKACVSGMSVSRWKNKGATSTHMFRSRAVNSTVDCSISELISTQHIQPRDLLGGTMNFCTPVRASQLNLNLSSLLGHTHTWSRLKAAVSVHRKMVLSPRSQFSTPSKREVADVSQDLFATPSRTPFPKRLLSQLMAHHSSVACEDDDLSDAEKVYAECSQQHPLPWEECILPQRMKRCVKIGEGTFGEVFSTTNASGDTVALKVIPIEGSEKVNGEDQKTFGEILHEIIISKELSTLKEKQHNQTHGFIGLNDLHCVKGCYPPDFLNAWDTFDRRKGSENDRPDFFEEDQLFIILEFEFGGVDLENSNGKLSSLMVAKSILHQVTAALAVAEQELHFEHRDLHWGNVLVKSTRQKKGSFLLNGKAHSLENKGVLVRIIDYSLSRLEIDDLTVSCDIANDEELFMGQGDYQFDIYRMMRKENGNNWSNYHPYTNVLWLHYLCTKLLSMKYRGGRGAKDTGEELTRFLGNVLQYSSATEVLQNCPMFQ